MTPIFPLLLLPLLAAAATTDPDFILVGAGTAGCALTGRLCRALPSATFVILERGRPRNATEEFTVRSMRSWWGSLVYPSLAEPITSTDTRPQPFVTGNSLGGTSSINGGQITFPRLGTTAGWGVVGATPASEREMRRRVVETLSARVADKELQPQYGQFLFDAAKEAGFEELEDGDEQLGEDEEVREKAVWNSRLAATPESGRRRDSYTAYLEGAVAGECEGRVRIVMGAVVGSVIVEGGKAKGVEYVDAGGKSRALYARREVIVSAGPLQTPKLLQLSGIGPRPLLESKGVEVKVDLPVGVAAHGRVFAALSYIYSGVPLADSNNNTKMLDPAEIARFKRGETSLYGENPSAIQGSVGKLGYFVFITASPVNASDPSRNVPAILASCVQNPRSRSTVSIRDADPASTPDVFLNTLATDEEADELLACTQKIRKIGDSLAPAFGAVEAVPGLTGLTRDWIRSAALTAYHFVGGAPVGSVLDERLRVRGVQNLRVVDASAIPDMPDSAGPLSSVYVLAEYAAEIIKDDTIRCKNYC